MSRMPVVFIGHGSPMNAIEDNDYTKNWRKIAERIPKPKAIISFSAHWFTEGTRIMNEENPKTIYDMYGFPKELYEIVYNVPGSPELAKLSKEAITRETQYDNSWGIDHGTWSVLVHMYPEKDIPLFQISVDAFASPEAHYQVGKDLSHLRDEGVLLFGTGNIVHNLRLVDWHMSNKGFDWAYEFDDFIYDNIVNRNHEKVLAYKQLGETAKLAVPSTDHFDPLLYILGASSEEDEITSFNKSCELGSLTMTSYLFE
ncbi:MAG: 4,5-DOPA dioxygenase extradiol [Clostridiales bacterium]|nr:4,5-DOPA dioxygenase extradiol [Clostridiales bacterium]